MATSILDYIFRELAISYLGRNELAHVEPADLMPDTVGRGATESQLDAGGQLGAQLGAMVERVASKGYVRSSNMLMMKRSVATQAGDGAGVQLTEASMTVALDTKTLIQEFDARAEQIRRARMKGYEGDACPECGNFTLVRNGTCLKCDTCGGTTGCS